MLLAGSLVNKKDIAGADIIKDVRSVTLSNCLLCGCGSLTWEHDVV